MFGVLIVMLWLNDCFLFFGFVGLVCGFFGVVLISFEKVVGVSLSLILILVVLGVICCYGFGVCLLKKFFVGVKFVVVVGGS